jgi:hypothetical protein
MYRRSCDRVRRGRIRVRGLVTLREQLPVGERISCRRRQQRRGNGAGSGRRREHGAGEHPGDYSAAARPKKGIKVAFLTCSAAACSLLNPGFIAAAKALGWDPTVFTYNFATPGQAVQQAIDAAISTSRPRASR